MYEASGAATARQRLGIWAAWAARGSFAAVIVLIPFRYHVVVRPRPMVGLFSGYTDFLLYAADEALLPTFLLWLASRLLAPRRVSLGPRHLWIPMLGLLAAASLSALGSFDPPLSVYHAIRLLGLFWLYVFVVNEACSTGWVVVAAAVSITIEAVVALGQFLVQHSVELGRIGELYLDPSAPSGSVIVAGGERLMRAYGLTDHPNILGGCLAFGLILLLPSLLRKAEGPLPWTAFFPALGALVASFSRSAWLSLATGGAVLVGVDALRRRWQTARSALGVGAAGVVVLGVFLLAYPAFIGTRLNAGHSFASASPEQQSIGQRIILIQLAAPIWRDHVLGGVGLGASPIALEAYYPRFALNYEPPHWALFDAALETGLLGGASYLALIVFPAWVFIRRRALWEQPAAAAAFALLIGIAVVGLFDYYTWLLEAGRLWQWLAWGLWGAALRPAPTGHRSTI